MTRKTLHLHGAGGLLYEQGKAAPAQNRDQNRLKLFKRPSI